MALLADHLRFRRLLLVLDNCEDVISVAAMLTGALLQACPELRVIATSREPLGIAEVTWRVRSLAVPERRRPPPPERLMGYEAVRLFVDRASQRRHAGVSSGIRGPLSAEGRPAVEPTARVPFASPGDEANAITGTGSLLLTGPAQ